ncbi:MAG TPA: 23S rRNA (uracil(1939)-C(5))-methyltransferase RlmD [Candidatus Baltobacteraceae bacterium]
MTIKNTRSPVARPGAIRVGSEIEIGFTDLLSNGQAVGRAGGVVVFCFGPLPQERALVRVTAVKPKYAVGELLKLTAGSPHRVVPFCEVFGACGGCQVQHLAYSAQLAWKRDVVRGALARIGGFPDAVVREPIGMANPRAYRNKMSLVVDHTYTTPTIGFYQQRSHDVVAIDACPIVTPPLNDYIGRLNRARMTAETAPALLDARHVIARSARATGETVVTLTTATASEAARAAGPALMKALPGAVGIVNSYDLNSANAIVGRTNTTVAGASEIEEQIDGVRYRVSAGSFFQVNVEIVNRIFGFMKAGLTKPRRIVDLYCGAGTFALFFAKHGSTVYGIEESPQAVAEAEENARLNGFESRASFHAGKVEDVVRAREARQVLKDAQIVFLDPPRKGSDEITLGAVAAAQPPNIWYLSCDPATLARDLKFLVAKGYTIGVVQPFDMFPQTGHVETLVTLYREDAAPRISVEEAFADVPDPVWPEEADAPQPQTTSEYPDFVIRQD